MLEKLYNQYDPKYAGHALGSGKGELGPYGCNECCDTMIVYDAYPDMHYDPASFDDLMYSRGQFSGDLLNQHALDQVWPGRFKTTVYDGMRLDIARVLLPAYSKVDYLKLWISGAYSPLWKQVIPTHFVLLLRADGWIADPAGGVVRSINAYGGWSAVKAMYHVHCTPLALAKPPAPVNPPVVSPAPLPAPVAPSFFSVCLGQAVIASGLGYDEALGRAQTAATLRPGTLYEVQDAKGKVVGTGYVALPPAPIVAPVTPQPTPAPPHVQQPDFWAVLQSVLVQLLAPVFGRR